MNRIRAWAARAWAMTRVVLTSWPAGAIVTGLSLTVVPELPGPWALKAGAVLAGVATVVRVVGHAVAVLTPVLFPANRGILAPPPAQSPTVRPGAPSHVRLYDQDAATEERTWRPGDPGPLPPVPPEAYPPGSERLPLRRRR